MASLVTEEQLINQLAAHAGTITGITNAYGFAQNPDALPDGVLPAMVFYPASGTQERKAHFNTWTNSVLINGLLFVSMRMSKGGTLKLLENKALAFPQRFRQKFQEESVVRDYLALGCQVADFRSWQYGSGGLLLYMDVEYIGFVMEWEFRFTR